MLRILGINGEQRTCDMCGREDLERTVVVADDENEVVGRYGTSCVDIVLGRQGKGRTTAVKVAEIEACRRDAIYCSLRHFDMSYDPAVKGQQRMAAITMLNDAIKAHNKIPVDSTRRAIMARVERLKDGAAALYKITRDRVE